jgi:hypothetical protein
LSICTAVTYEHNHARVLAELEVMRKSIHTIEVNLMPRHHA